MNLYIPGAAILFLMGYLLHQTRGLFSASNMVIFPLIYLLFLPVFQKPVTQRTKERIFFWLAFVFALVSTIEPRIIYPSQMVFFWNIRLFHAAILLCLILVSKKGPTQLLWVSLFLCAGIGMASVVFASPNAGIDVWTTGNQAVEAFLSGKNPYSISYVPLYKDRGYEEFFGYPPLLLFWYIPWKFIGDIRFGWVALYVLNGFLLAKLATKKSGKFNFYLVAAFLCFPMNLLMVEQSWIDPLSICFAVTMALSYFSKRNISFAITLGLWIAAKPTNWMVAPLFLYWMWNFHKPNEFLKSCFIAFLVVGVFYLPFLVWDYEAFVSRVLWFTGSSGLTGGEPLQLSFRMDSLSWPVLFYKMGWGTLWKGFGWVLLILQTFWFAHRFKKRGTVEVLFWGVSFTYIVFFSFSTWAFCNYYVFSTFGIWIALAVQDRPILKT